MPELPEIFNLSKQFNMELRGKKIADIEVKQEKCLNLPLSDFKLLVMNKTIGDSTPKGKWIFTKLEPDGYFLLSLGMGGNVLYHKLIEQLPDKYQLKFDFNDGTFLSIGFWWFGYAHATRECELKMHKMTNSLGLNPLDESDFTFERFNSLLNFRKGNIKSFLMEQKNIAGIGNVYIQDILFKSGIHPNRKIPSIGLNERDKLFNVIKENLKAAAELGGLGYERDIYNQPGRFNNFLVGYREGCPCPECGMAVEKIKTGATASFICSRCQK